MVFRKFLIWLVKNLIVLLLVAFVFSTVALDLPYMAKGALNDIFQYANPAAQKEVVGKLTMACSSLDGKNTSELQGQMSRYEMPIDLSKVGALCKEYNSGKINDKEFFFGVVSSSVPDKLEIPKAGIFEKYNSIIDFLIKNKMYYFIILLVLAGLLYLLAGSFAEFTIILTGMSFSMGVLILLPYAAIVAYSGFVGFDTTPIMSSILNGSLSLDIKAITSVVLLMILRIYTSFIIILGAALLGIGIAGKIYFWRLKKRRENPGGYVSKKPEKNIEEKTSKAGFSKENPTKEEKEEAYLHRDRSTKEILDELEDINKKKNRKD